MKSKYLLVSLVLGFGLVLSLLWALGDGSALAVAPNTPATELHVCVTCTFTTVQAAVDAATGGDVIKVAAGVYTGVRARGRVTQVVYISKSVVIRGGYAIDDWGTSDPDTNPTTLNAQERGRVFYITGDISPTIESLRITGGDAAGLGGGSGGWDAGGGLYIVNATAVISNNQVFSNTAYGGGGFYLHGSATMLNANTISDNATSGAEDGGGGLYLSESPATLSANTISSNDTTNKGGGLYLFSSDATLDDNIVSLNSAGDEGGGLYLNDSNVTLLGNTIISNVAYSGGGLFLLFSDAVLGGNTVVANNAESGGGLFVREQSDVTLDNNVVADNQAASTGGGGVHVAGASIRMRHNTIARNGGESGIYVTNYESNHGTATLTNTILVSHTVGIKVTANNVASLEATLWGDGAWANIADDWGGAGSIFTGTVNVYGDPAFVGNGDYHITDGSAAKDRGVDAELNPDMDLDLRPIGAGFDIGADEFPVVVTTTESISVTLVYTDPQGNITRLMVPAGAATNTIKIVYTPKDPQVALPLPKGMALGPHVFELDVYRNDVLVPHFAFERVVTLTSEYSDTGVVGMIEDTLALYRETGGEWKKIGARIGETYTLDVENNVLTAYLLGTSAFREMGAGTTPRFLFLPMVIRNS